MVVPFQYCLTGSMNMIVHPSLGLLSIPSANGPQNQRMLAISVRHQAQIVLDRAVREHAR